MTKTFSGERFFVRSKAKCLRRRFLFLVLLVVEVTDVTFAVDSIPAVFGITRDPFIVYTSKTYLRFWDCGRCTFAGRRVGPAGVY